MKHIKSIGWLGVAGSLLVPALAVAALELPNTFAAGEPVSASAMNANFQAVKAKVEQMESDYLSVDTLGSPATGGNAPAAGTQMRYVGRTWVTQLDGSGQASLRSLPFQNGILTAVGNWGDTPCGGMGLTIRADSPSTITASAPLCTNTQVRINLFVVGW